MTYESSGGMVTLDGRVPENSEVRVCELEADDSEGPCEEYRVAEEGRVEKEQQIAARGTNYFTLYNNTLLHWSFPIQGDISWAVGKAYGKRIINFR